MLRISGIWAIVLIASTAQALEIGESVIVIQRSQLVVEEKVVDVVPAGAELTVDAIEGDWVWVSNGTPGWLHRDRVKLPAEALEHYSNLLKAQPGNAELFFLRGNVYRSLEDYDRAVADFDAAIRIAPQAAGYNGRGRTHYEAGNMDEAIADFTRAIELNPRSALLYNNRSAALEKKGDLRRALADLERARELDPNHEFVLQNHARLSALVTTSDASESP